MAPSDGIDRRPTVLIVDDDADFREAASELLEMNGFDVRLASSGADGLAMLKAGVKPEVILLDQQMPGMDGLTFRGHQLGDEALANIPVIIYTAGPAVQAHGTLVMSKLIEPRLLVAALRAICAVGEQTPKDRRQRHEQVLRALARLQTGRAS